jgi:hypothetical protein
VVIDTWCRLLASGHYATLQCAALQGQPSPAATALRCNTRPSRQCEHIKIAMCTPGNTLLEILCCMVQPTPLRLGVCRTIPQRLPMSRTELFAYKDLPVRNHWISLDAREEKKRKEKEEKERGF